MGIFSLLGVKTPNVAAGKTAHDFSFEKIEGGELRLAEFKGKVLLIVNTASKCGFTKQYRELEELYQTYKDKGLVVIGVPSNDFGGQEPAAETEIKSFCETRFGVTFPLTAKTVVSGSDAHPFYQWGAQALGFGTKPKWNFHKYLVDQNGKLIDYFHSTTSPNNENISKAINKLF